MFQVCYKMCSTHIKLFYLMSESKHFRGKENSSCFRWLPAAKLVDHRRSINMAASCETLWQINNSETMFSTELRIGEEVYIHVFLFTTFQVVGFFYWTVSNLLFVTWPWKRSIHAHIAHRYFDIVAFVLQFYSYVVAFFFCHSSWTKIHLYKSWNVSAFVCAYAITLTFSLLKSRWGM